MSMGGIDFGALALASHFSPGPLEYFLPLDEAVVSRAVVVIVSGSDGRAVGRKRFWSQLNN